MLVSLYFAFTDFRLLTPPKWVGLANFQRAAADPIFWLSVKNTLTYIALAVPLKLAVGLAVAVLLNARMRGLTFYRSALYVPSLLGASVALSITWKQAFSADGFVNLTLGVFGIEGPNWVDDPRYALYTLVLLSVWQFGATMLIFLAGLKQIPQELYEAAAIDGAGRPARFLRITVPLLTPIIFFNLVMQVIGSFQAFSQAYVINGPANSTLLYSVYLYDQGFVRFAMGYASAMAWLLLVAVAVVTGLNFFGAKYWVHHDDKR